MSTLSLQGQTLGTLGTGKVVELECLQNPSGTLITATMERLKRNNAIIEKVMIYRSVNSGQFWTVTDSIISPKNVADPVLAVDGNGNVYLIVMRIEALSNFRIDLDLFVSTDDGLSWQFVNSPNFDQDLADYPQLIAKANGQLFLSYTRFVHDSITSSLRGEIVFKKSTDGGINWSTEEIFTIPENKPVGADFTFGNQNDLYLTFGHTTQAKLYFSKSIDLGNNWQALDSIANSDIFNVTKPAFDSVQNHLSILSHKPHQNNSPINYHFSSDGGISWQATIIDSGAYAQSLSFDSTIHVIYNQLNGSYFQLVYRTSTDQGFTFSNPIILYKAKLQNTEAGEYQSFFRGNDGRFYVIFCDWADSSRAKTIVFSEDVSLKETKASKKTIAYPNPNNGLFKLDLSALPNVKTIQVYNEVGEILKTLNPKGEKTISVNLAAKSAGIYYLHLMEDNRVLIEKIVKF